MYRKVTFYKTVDGKCPVAEFIDSQPPKVAQKIAWILKAVQELEKVPKTPANEIEICKERMKEFLSRGTNK